MDLQQFFAETPRLAIAFSGGVDSAYLLYAALQHGAEARAYYVKSPFQPQFELDDARRLAGELGAELTVLPLDILTDAAVTANPPNRCYHCKKRIFSTILQAASVDSFRVLADGTNASDEASGRPGMRALAELSVRSPLRECGLTKDEIRKLSRRAGLFTWNKPAYACLATRIPSGEPITAENLQKTEAAERTLSAFGLADFRVRLTGGAAKIQVRAEQLPLVLSQREAIINALKPYYQAVLLDLEVRG